MSRVKDLAGDILKSACNVHYKGALPDIFLFATPRGGSTWVMEVIASQPLFKYYDEPFNLRRRPVRRTQILQDWADLMPEANNAATLINYLKALQRNKYGFMNPPPFRKNHRFLTNRIVFKLHAAEYLIEKILRQCNGQVVYLIRHPIPTSLSRYVLPRLEHFVRSPYYRTLIGDADNLKEIRRIADKGNPLERGVLSWCYENVDALRCERSDEWTFLSYEELLLRPETTCRKLADRLTLPKVDRMVKATQTPASNIALSRKETIDILGDTDPIRRRSQLVTKWKSTVSDEQERQAMDILALFDLDAYSVGNFVPNAKYLFDKSIAV